MLWLLTLAFVLRLLLQLVRADFRDPMADAVVRVTNWLILPLRRVLPPIGKVDTATVVAVLAVAAARTATVLAFSGSRLADPLVFTRITIVGLADLILRIYLFAMLLYWLTSFVSPGRLCAGRPLARAALRTGLEAGAARDTAHRADRFLLPLGVHRDRRAADTTALNMRAYMPEITANDPA